MGGIKNAIIKGARITTADHGVLVVWLDLDYGGTCQGFGGYACQSQNKLQGIAGHFIWRILDVAGVEDWSDVIGRTIRVKATHYKVEAIGHIVKEDWFCPEESYKDLSKSS